MNNLTGIFQCTKCNLVFTASPNPIFLIGWGHLECPNLCVNEIKYDNCSKYHTSHKYFKWLNYEQLFGKETKNDRKHSSKQKNKNMD